MWIEPKESGSGFSNLTVWLRAEVSLNKEHELLSKAWFCIGFSLCWEKSGGLSWVEFAVIAPLWLNSRKCHNGAIFLNEKWDRKRDRILVPLVPLILALSWDWFAHSPPIATLSPFCPFPLFPLTYLRQWVVGKVLEEGGSTSFPASAARRLPNGTLS